MIGGAKQGGATCGDCFPWSPGQAHRSCQMEGDLRPFGVDRQGLPEMPFGLRKIIAGQHRYTHQRQGDWVIWLDLQQRPQAGGRCIRRSGIEVDHRLREWIR